MTSHDTPGAPHFALGAPIEPGASAAGIKLGDDIARFRGGAPRTTRPERRRFVDFPAVQLRADDRGRLTFIHVRAPYRGPIIDTAVAIGSTLRQAAEALGPIALDQEDNIVVRDVPGIGFETTRWEGWNPDENLDATITAIWVSAPSERTNRIYC